MSIRLSEHFELSEFMTSQTVARRGWVWPEMPEDVLTNLRSLTQLVGEPLRTALGGVPIVVSSGWRFEQLNHAIGGSPRSAHLDGRAMDITVPGVDLREVAEVVIIALEDVDKVILEHDAWIHVQIARPGGTPRRQALCAYIDHGKTCYAQGFAPPRGWL